MKCLQVDEEGSSLSSLLGSIRSNLRNVTNPGVSSGRAMLVKAMWGSIIRAADIVQVIKIGAMCQGGRKEYMGTIRWLSIGPKCGRIV